MGLPEKLPDMSLAYFRETLSDTMDLRNTPISGIDRALENAKDAVKLLDRVERGEVTVDPPIPEGEIQLHRQHVVDVIRALEMGVYSMSLTRSSRKRLSKAVAATAERLLDAAGNNAVSNVVATAPNFRGEAKEAKI